jgi:hypothetical protein
MLEDDKRNVPVDTAVGPKGVMTVFVPVVAIDPKGVVTTLGLVEAVAWPEGGAASFVVGACRFCATKLIVVARIPFMISSSCWDFLTSNSSVFVPCAQASAPRQKMIVRLDRVLFIFFALLVVSG